MTDGTLREPRPSHTKPDREFKNDPIADDSFEKEIRRICWEEWLSVLAKLWTALGKPVDAKRLEIYSEILGVLPLELLELGVKRALQEHTFSSVPPPGAVYQAAIRDLGRPENLMEDCGDGKESGFQMGAGFPGSVQPFPADW